MLLWALQTNCPLEWKCLNLKKVNWKNGNDQMDLVDTFKSNRWRAKEDAAVAAEKYTEEI